MHLVALVMSVQVWRGNSQTPFQKLRDRSVSPTDFPLLPVRGALLPRFRNKVSVASLQCDLFARLFAKPKGAPPGG
jgi:hypothetical protein